MERFPRKLALLAALLLVAYLVESREHAEASDGVRYETLQLIEDLPGYARHRAFYSAAFDTAHREAFAAGRAAGARYGGTGFDEDAYHRAFFGHLSRRARAADLPALAANITAYGQDRRGFGVASAD